MFSIQGRSSFASRPDANMTSDKDELTATTEACSWLVGVSSPHYFWLMKGKAPADTHTKSIHGATLLTSPTPLHPHPPTHLVICRSWCVHRMFCGSFVCLTGHMCVNLSLNILSVSNAIISSHSSRPRAFFFSKPFPIKKTKALSNFFMSRKICIRPQNPSLIRFCAKEHLRRFCSYDSV